MVSKAICNKGFRGNSSVVARSNFRVGGQETAPQSLTAYSLDRYAKMATHIRQSTSYEYVRFPILL